MSNFERSQLKDMVESKRGDSAFGKPLRENFEKAQERLQQYQQMQEKFEFSDREIELLADSENPYRLAKFSEQDRMRLSEMLQEVQEKDANKGEESSQLKRENVRARDEQEAQKLAAVRESLSGGEAGSFNAEQLQESIAQGKKIPIRILRSSGVMEEGWFVLGVDAEKNEALVKNFQIPGSPMSKRVSLENLRKWNVSG